MSGLPPLAGIHHVKYAVSDLTRALAFYEAALGAVRRPELDHRRESTGELYAYLCELPGLGTGLELRLNPDQAEAGRGFDPITIAVPDRETLHQWGDHLDAVGVTHSGILASIQSWLIAFDDPDGNRLRLYSLETHGDEIRPQEDDPWIAGGTP